MNHSAIAPIVLSHMYCYSDSINVRLEVGGIIPVFGNIIFHVTPSVLLVPVICGCLFQNYAQSQMIEKSNKLKKNIDRHFLK
jgi:hypothetical protein